MRWPGTIPAGSFNNEISGIIDLLPTFCAIAGVKSPADRVMDGRNILPYLRGEKLDAPIHESFIVPGSAIRHGDWKLFVKDQKPGGKGARGMQGRKPAGAGSLFQVGADPGETLDLSEQFPGKVTELTRLMRDYMRELAANTRSIGGVE